MPVYGSRNRSHRWLRTRIRCSRVAFPPKASIGETSAAAFITLSGMTRLTLQSPHCAQPRPAAVPQSLAGRGGFGGPALPCFLPWGILGRSWALVPPGLSFLVYVFESPRLGAGAFFLCGLAVAGRGLRARCLQSPKPPH